jgi:hypothetical protein
MNDRIIVLVIVFIFTILCGVFLKLWTHGKNEEHYVTICIGGHEYWRADFAAKGFLAVKLDDDGKPIRCRGGE